MRYNVIGTDVAANTGAVGAHTEERRKDRAILDKEKSLCEVLGVRRPRKLGNSASALWKGMR